MSVLILTLATCIVIFSGEDIDDEQGEEKYYATTLILTGSMIGLVCAADLFNLWVWFEATAFSSYLLVAFYRDRRDALGACVKYFIQTISGSVLALFAIALILAQSGTLDIATINAEKSPLVIVAGALFIMGFGVKAALAPNYTWAPDAYAESPTPISALLSGIVTVTALIALMRALAVSSWSPDQWGVVLMIIGSANIVIGNVLAFSQTQVKRILAYSSVSHIGFITLALGIGVTVQSADGMQSAMLHLFIHGLMKALAFLALGALAYSWRARTGAERLITVNDLKGAAQRCPGIVLALTLALLSLAGVPPLAGFISKLRILSAGVNSQSDWILALTAMAALNSVLSLGYYLPIINALYSFGGESNRDQATIAPLAMRAPVFLLATLIVIFGVAPGLLDGLTDAAGSALMTLFGGKGG
jgi:proton-translocating NADH-quinone oxidoreductase chain N